jgi:hypothetical protein
LVEELDYVVLPVEAWKLLVSWYGGAPEVFRSTIDTESGKIVDLYPTYLRLQKKQPNGNLDQNFTLSLVIPSN